MAEDQQTERIAVWPCDHNGVQVEPGPALKGYQCAECGAVASTYVLAQTVERLATAAERYVQASYKGEQTVGQRHDLEQALAPFRAGSSKEGQ